MGGETLQRRRATTGSALPTPGVASIRGRAMGTRCHVIVHADDPALADELAELALDEIDDLEQRWSRFDPRSEVSRINAAGDGFVPVSAETVDLVVRSVRAWHLTGGRFDPTVHDLMIALGYDRPFDEGPVGRSVRLDRRTGDCGSVEVDLDARAVRLPPGTNFDPGGIGKGLAADRVSHSVMRRGALGAMVNLGGDLRVRGDAPGGDSWIVEVGESSARPEPYATIALTDGAVATSTTLRRRWPGLDGGDRHHLIDPCAGLPHTETGDDVVVATAIAGDGWWAEAAATASIGRGAAPMFAAQILSVTADGDVRRTDGFHRYER